ncbi:tetratricopeptide repeat protein [Luteolibacter ambystomatis]|uniref:Tetratricopeptide repeat protein n=1 Tax=Luteolibacter ambystomatis TaxID=2824561 RepID=A0A975PFY6_9BACT|nr:tetratricopeptide repeat protein [Luteolibacter ambystomatis]QUE52313.1 tetratricopeptide repeat protein [Luteolibacter ambystomatis]
MKKHFLPLTLLLGAAVTAIAEEKPAADKPVTEKATEKKDTPQYTPNQQAFLNLPEEKRTEYAKHLQEAYRVFQEKRVFETLDELAKARAIFKDDPDALNLFGSCQVEFRAFDKAMEAYIAADKLSPDNPNIRFNIGEVYFVTKKWKECLDTFEKVLKLVAEKNIKLDPGLLRLMEFKVLLCKIKLGKKEEAEILAEKYDYLDDSPYYYFAHAAMAYEKKDEINAEEWLARANRIFNNPATLSPWQDTMVEFGYIKSFYGEDSAAPAAAK